jgi:tetratricopeptide (TPR) repeat protein
MRVVHLDEIKAILVAGTLNWKPIRKTLGVTAFGINAYRAEHAGDEVIEDHDESRLGHEELYLVLSGTAVFTVAGETFEAPTGTLVYLDDPSDRRAAVAKDAGTTVLAVGGVPGQHEISAWEYFFPAAPFARIGDYRRAKAIVQEGLEEKPNHPALLYNLACWEARLGENDLALDHLNAAVAREQRFREYAATDEDLDSIREDPRFPS